MEIRLLGPIEAVDGEPVALGGSTQRRVLAALALRRNEVVSVARLVELIWPNGEPPARADHNVRTYVHRLRSALGPLGDRIETAPAGYRIRLDVDELDAARFERLARIATQLAETGDTVAALDHIGDAERLWRGEPIEEFQHEPWAVPDVVRLVELRTELRTQRAAVLIELGRSTDAVSLLEALVRDEPLRERPRALLMRALYDAGRQVEALRAFQDFRRLLTNEVGVQPSPALVDLDRALATGGLPAAGGRTRSVGGYELHERIGEGSFGVVHRATQSSLGREVAVKIIRAELANQSGFIRRFESEARMVARIEHPNVVPLYDYWREPDRAFLVMRWMTGGSLDARLGGGQWSLDDTVELVEQVAAGLEAAHAVGVVHRDVKPENILFDGEGRAYLGDFGIALDTAEESWPEAAVSGGSPAFASPGQLRHGPVGAETDVHALGIVAYTLLTGRTPFADAPDARTWLQRQLDDPIPPVRATRPTLPERVDEVFAVATAKVPSERYPTARTFAIALRAAASTSGAAPDAAASRRPRANPYKGLRAFDEADAADFYGREQLVDELITHLDEPDTRLLAVVGPSGSGKSSVVRAGLVPALRDGRVPGSSQWFFTTLIPGARPFEALETALLRVAVNPPSALLEQLRDGERGLLRAISRILPDDSAVMAIVIDQFEELFTADVAGDECDLFLRALTIAATEPGSPARFVVTLRADVYDRPLRHSQFAPLLKWNTVAVTPLAPDELERAIVAPAAPVGVMFEPGLVARILADVNREPGALPLLQYALTQAFEQTEGAMITIDDYQSIGGVTGALTRRAEELWHEADEHEQAATRRLFGRLVDLGGGTEGTGRRVQFAELGDDSANRAAISRYGQARLLTFDRDQATREPTVEVAHEALIREWPRLRGWIDDDRETLRTHRHLTAAAGGWIERHRDPNELYRGARLENARTLLSADTVHLNENESDFLAASTRQQQEEARAERHRIRRLHRLVTATAIVAALAVVAGVVAFWQRQRAEEVAYDAETARLVATAQSLAPTKPREAMLLAVAANRREQTPATLGALQSALSQTGPVLGYLGWGTDYHDVEWFPNARIAGVRVDGLDLFDRSSGTLLDTVDLDLDIGPPVNGSDPWRAAGRSDLLAVAVGSTVHVYSVGDRLDQRFERSMPSAVVAVDVAPDGQTVVATSVDGTIAAWSSEGDERFPSFAMTLQDNLADQYDARFDVPLALRESYATLPVWIAPVAHEDHIHLHAGAQMFSIGYDGEFLAEPVYGFVDFDAFGRAPAPARHVVHPTPDETVVASASTIGRLDARGNAADVARLAVAEGVNSSIDSMIDMFVGRDGRPITLLDDGTLVWFDPDSGARLESVNLGLGAARSAAPGPEPGTVAIAWERGIVLVSVDGAGALTRGVSRLPRQTQLSVSMNGRFVVLAGAAGGPVPVTLLEQDSDEGSYRARSDFQIATASWAAAAPDYGSPLVVLGVGGATVIDGVGFVFRTDTSDAPSLLGSWTLPGDGGASGDFDPRWRWLVSDLGVAERIGVFEMPSEAGAALTAVTDLPRPPGARGILGVTGIRFDPSGDRLLVSSSTGRSQLYDTETWTLVDDEILAGHDIATGYWNHDGALLATASSNGQITIRDGATFEPIRSMVGAVGTLNSGQGVPLLFSDDDALLLSSHDNVARLWDVGTGQQIGTDMITAEGTISGINTGDPLQLITGTDDGALVWNLDTESWADIACRSAGSNLSPAEWDQWGPRDEEYRAICEQFALTS